MPTSPSPLVRAEAFCSAYGLRLPVLLAPMAGACPPSLSAAVANAGGMGACGALLMDAEAIAAWMAEYRATSNGAVMLNTWVPDPAPVRDAAHEHAVSAFLSQWGPTPPEGAADSAPLDFDAQCEAMLASGAPILSSIMGLFPSAFVDRMRARGVKWFATVTTGRRSRSRGGRRRRCPRRARHGSRRPSRRVRRGGCRTGDGRAVLAPAGRGRRGRDARRRGGRRRGRARRRGGVDARRVGRADRHRAAPHAGSQALRRSGPTPSAAPARKTRRRPARFPGGWAVRSKRPMSLRRRRLTRRPPAPYPVQRGLTKADARRGGAGRRSRNGCRPEPANRPVSPARRRRVTSSRRSGTTRRLCSAADQPFATDGRPQACRNFASRVNDFRDISALSVSPDARLGLQTKSAGNALRKQQ